ncbi:MAG: tail fiber domain-containing protein [Terrimonas sp.]|nr:tail fiber domain-containing protein [Terrimonas sp.]
MKKQILSVSFLLFASIAFAQIQLHPGYVTIGPVAYKTNYYTTAHGSLYLTNDNTSTNFFQFDIWNGRIATTGNWCVFYNSQTSTFNDLAVGTVYNYSDSRAKRNVAPIKYGLSSLSKLKPVNYNLLKNPSGQADHLELGLLAQEVEQVMPELVRTDDEGKKLLNYVGLIPVLIQSIKDLQAEVEALKAAAAK